MVTVAPDVVALLVIVLMPITSSSASSILMAMPSSDWLAEPLLYSTETVILFGSVAGKASLRRLPMVEIPAAMISSISKLAATGLEANQAIIPRRGD